jgi:hypothetical protein
MTRDSRQTLGGQAFDDDEIGQLVRDVAAGWTMPPQRLDAPSWRDRVRSPRARRIASVRGWFGRVGQAAAAAVALTVIGALVAVVITRPPVNPGKSPAASPGSSPRASAGAQASPLPKLIVPGAQPNPAVVIVQTDLGDFARVDLEKGTIGTSLTTRSYSTSVHVASDGTLTCLCVAESGQVNGNATRMDVTFQQFAPDGSQAASVPVETFIGKIDPRDPVGSNPDNPSNVLVKTSYSDDGRYGFVGWSVRAHPVWHSGIVVVDLRDGSLVSRLDLPDATTGADTARRLVDAPRVVGVAGSGELVLARSWYESTQSTQFGARYTFDNDVYRVGFAAGTWSDLTAMPAAANCGNEVIQGGPLAAGGTWLVCGSGGTSLTVIRRIAADSTSIGDIRVTSVHAIEGEMVAASPDGSRLFVWDPVSAILTRVDLATGETTTGTGPTARLDRGPLSAIGEWLAPPVAAKSLLRGGVIVSADGSRVYGVGVNTDFNDRGVAGSAGVYAFDASTMASVGHWDPTADFVSLAISHDGASVYAAGLPGVDAAGNDQASQGASITVFSTRDGSVQLIAGELGFGMLTFPSPVLN